MVLAIVAGLAALAAAVLKLWAGVTLMTDYRVDEYLATPRARKLYWTVMLAPAIVGVAVVILAYYTGFLLVELAAFAICAFIAGSTGWKLWMRFTGRYKAYHSERQWN